MFRRVASSVFLIGCVLALGASARGEQEQGQTAAPTPPAGAAPAAGGRGNFANNFTGKITVGNTSEMRTSRIRFEAGARTVWHIHDTPQLLLVEEGRGRFQEQGGPVRELLPGQPVLTKPNVLHWHGAAPDQAALQFSVFSGNLEWKHPVTDEEYLGKK